MCGPFEREIGGKRFKFMHGHEVDPVNSGDTPGKGRICCIVAGMHEDKNGSPVLPDGEFVEDHLEEIGDILEDIAGHVKRAESRLTGWWGWVSRLFVGHGLRQGTSPPLKIQIGPRRCLRCTMRTWQTTDTMCLLPDTRTILGTSRTGTSTAAPGLGRRTVLFRSAPMVMLRCLIG